MAESPPKLSLFAYDFRPFCLAAGLAAVVLMLVWLVMSSLGVMPPGNWAGTKWNGHEMLFAYALAVIAGFMLTAVLNWVGGCHLAGGKLVALFALWLPGLVLIALADVVPAGLAGAYRLWHADRRRHRSPRRPGAASLGRPLGGRFRTLLAGLCPYPHAAPPGWKTGLSVALLRRRFSCGHQVLASTAGEEGGFDVGR